MTEEAVEATVEIKGTTVTHTRAIGREAVAEEEEIGMMAAGNTVAVCLRYRICPVFFFLVLLQFGCIPVYQEKKVFVILVC